MILTYSTLGSEGRLGNQLWQIASTLGIAEKVQAEVQFPRWEYAKYFSIPEVYFVDEIDPRAIEATSTLFATNIHPNHRPYLQQLSLWKNVESLIRYFFQPSLLALDGIAKAVGEDLLDVFDMCCAVHVRRTDAVAKQNLFKVPDMSYFGPAMESIQYWEGEPRFLVFSDDRAWCEANFPDNVTYMTPHLPEPGRNERGDPLGNPTDWIDFFVMMCCRSHIISNSTFSWWPAWLSQDKHVIAPAQWYKGRFAKEIDLDNILPKKWTRM